MFTFVLILGVVCSAIASFGFIAVRKKELEEHHGAIVLTCMFAITAVVIIGIFAYQPDEPPTDQANAPAPTDNKTVTDSSSTTDVPRLVASTPETAPSEPETIRTVAEIEPTVAVLRKPGETFRDCDICPELVVVPAGNNDIGEEDGTPGTQENEHPLAWVRFDAPFAVGRYEVQVKEFKAFADDTGFKPDGPCNTDGVGGRNASYASPGLDQDENHPVVCVSADDARRYVAWLSRKTRQTYMLLSEARWEYARRSKTSVDKSPASDQNEHLAEIGNIRGDNWVASTVEVGRFRANEFILFDMMGNAAEWTSDCWQDNHLHQPKNGEAVMGSGDCTARAVRGGSWDEPATATRPASRRKVQADTRDWRIGFRIMRSIKTTTKTSSRN